MTRGVFCVLLLVGLIHGCAKPGVHLPSDDYPSIRLPEGASSGYSGVILIDPSFELENTSEMAVSEASQSGQPFKFSYRTRFRDTFEAYVISQAVRLFDQADVKVLVKGEALPSNVQGADYVLQIGVPAFSPDRRMTCTREASGAIDFCAYAATQALWYRYYRDGDLLLQEAVVQASISESYNRLWDGPDVVIGAMRAYRRVMQQMADRILAGRDAEA